MRSVKRLTYTAAGLVSSQINRDNLRSETQNQQSLPSLSIPKVFSIAKAFKVKASQAAETGLQRPETVVGFARFVELGMSSSSSVARVLRFDIFELDVRAGELRRKGVKVRLQGQPLQVLEALLRRSGDVVTREELRAQIWKDDTFVDFDHNLHNAIARLREVLGDSRENPRYIETLPRRGYRFLVPVESRDWLHTAQAPAPVPVAIPTEIERGAYGRRSWVLAVA